MKSCVQWKQWKPFIVEKISPPAEIELETARSAGQRLIHWATGAIMMTGTIQFMRIGEGTRPKSIKIPICPAVWPIQYYAKWLSTDNSVVSITNNGKWYHYEWLSTELIHLSPILVDSHLELICKKRYFKWPGPPTRSIGCHYSLIWKNRSATDAEKYLSVRFSISLLYRKISRNWDT